jgi:hypothetical protein
MLRQSGEWREDRQTDRDYAADGATTEKRCCGHFLIRRTVHGHDISLNHGRRPSFLRRLTGGHTTQM